jgi:hypothetical protein
MDEERTRKQVTDHADAVVRGDVDTVVADFSDELQPQAPAIIESLPQPVTAAEVLSLEVGDTEAVAQIRYTGESGEVTVRTRWQDQDGQPRIVHGEPIG